MRRQITARLLASSRRPVARQSGPPPFARTLLPVPPPCTRAFTSPQPQPPQQQQQQPQQPSLNAQFYRTFGRPIAKTFLLAVFTYQVAYYFWVRLEQNEIKGELQATINELEERVEQLEKARSP
jgi:hypothetical protein